jgi:hypothetical protein
MTIALPRVRSTQDKAMGNAPFPFASNFTREGETGGRHLVYHRRSRAEVLAAERRYLDQD